MYIYNELLKYNNKTCKVTFDDGNFRCGRLYIEHEDNTIVIHETNSIVGIIVDFDEIASIEIIEDKDAIDEA